MALIFLDGFDKYGPANTNSTGVAALLTAGEWTSATGSTFNLVAPLSNTGQALSVVCNSNTPVVKTLIANYARLIGGVRFSSTLTGAATGAGVGFSDAGTAQCTITVNAAGTISLRTGLSNGTALATGGSISANSTHYLEWDITFGAAAGYQVWLDGVSLFSGTGNTKTTANNYANQLAIQAIASGPTITFDDLYLFDTTGAAPNNAVLLTSPRIETQFPTGDAAVQFAVGAGILGNSIARTTGAGVQMAANTLRLRPITPLAACTVNSVSFMPTATNSSVVLRPVIYADSGGTPGALLGSGSTSTGITSGTTKTMPLTSGVALSAGTPYWIGFMNDILVATALTPYEAATTDRTAVSTFASGAPGTAPAMAAVAGTLIWGNLSSAPNWYAAGQNPTQGALSYLFDATVGHEDLYSFPSLSAPPSAIYAVAVKASLSKSDAGAKTASVRLKSAATDSAGTGGTALAPATSYGWITSHFPLDPNGNIAWTLAALNAAQAGVKVET